MIEYRAPGPVDLFIGPPFAPLAGASTTFPTANAARLYAFFVNRAVTVSKATFRLLDVPSAA